MLKAEVDGWARNRHGNAFGLASDLFAKIIDITLPKAKLLIYLHLQLYIASATIIRNS